MPDFADSGPVILALTIGIFAPLSGWVARQRARSAALWFALGALSGPFALLILAAAPPGRCPDCDRPVPGWDRACRFCGATFPPFWAEEEERPGRRPQPQRPPAAAGPATFEAPTTDVAPAQTPRLVTTPARVETPSVAASPSAEEEPTAEPAPTRTRRRGKTAAATVGGRPASRSPGTTASHKAEPAVAADTLAHETPRPAPSPASRPASRPGPPPVQPVTSAARPGDPEPARSPAAEAEVAPVAPTSPPPEPEPEVERVLSTGIYILGNAGLEVGARYGLARVGDRLRVFGPVDLGEVTVRHERRYAELEVTAIGDQLVISAAGKGSNLAMVFRGLGGMQPAEVERVLSARPAGPPPAQGRAP